MIRLLVVDDHPIVRQGLTAVLEDEPEFEVAGTAGSAEEAIELAGRLRPEVILLDLELPGMGGIEAIGHLLHQAPETGILVFTAYAGDERVIGAVRAGAKGYLLKGAAAGEIARAVRAVRAGETFLEPVAASTLIAHLSAPRRASGLLTEREQMVLRLVAQGLPNKQIARSLQITERTVKFHVTSILRKLDADNRAQAVNNAMQRGLLG